MKKLQNVTTHAALAQEYGFQLTGTTAQVHASNVMVCPQLSRIQNSGRIAAHLRESRENLPHKYHSFADMCKNTMQNIVSKWRSLTSSTSNIMEGELS